MKAKILVYVLPALILVTIHLAQAQQAGKAARIGYLDLGTAAGSGELLDAFRRQMTKLSWIEGKNLTIEYRYGEGKGDTRLASS